MNRKWNWSLWPHTLGHNGVHPLDAILYRQQRACLLLSSVYWRCMVTSVTSEKSVTSVTPRSVLSQWVYTVQCVHTQAATDWRWRASIHNNASTSIHTHLLCAELLCIIYCSGCDSVNEWTRRARGYSFNRWIPSVLVNCQRQLFAVFCSNKERSS